MVEHNLEYYLQDSVRIEISTIPLYLFAMYSIKKDTDPGVKARGIILAVIKQEMLHLALAGNLMAAAGGGPILYNKDYFPTYGGPDDTILKTKIPLILDRCEESSLETFIKIEAPWPLSSPQRSVVLYSIIAEDENSIGTFYQQLEMKIDAGSNDFNKNGNTQFPNSENPDPDTQVTLIVTDKESAKKALKVIIDQGEGGSGGEDGHYQMFKALSDRYNNPRERWSCWKVKRNPSHKDYQGKPLIENLNDAFNAANCYLLLAISKVWHTGDDAERNKLFDTYREIMVYVLSTLGDLLVSLPLSTDDDTEYAAPTFEKYIASRYDHPLKPSDIDGVAQLLREKVKKHIEEAKKHSQNLNDKQRKSLDDVLSSIKGTSWPKKE